MNIRNFFARETRLLTLSTILFATGGALLLAPKTSAWAQGAPAAKVEADLQAFKVAGTLAPGNSGTVTFVVKLG